MDIQGIENMPLAEAKDTAKTMIETRKTRTINQKTAKAQIIRDIDDAPSSQEVSRIMWQQLLASEGLRTSGSAWKKKYDNI